MCESEGCGARGPHFCQVTGAVELGRVSVMDLSLSQHHAGRTRPYLNPRHARMPENADIPRRTEDIGARDYVHRENRTPWLESPEDRLQESYL